MNVRFRLGGLGGQMHSGSYYERYTLNVPNFSLKESFDSV